MNTLYVSGPGMLLKGQMTRGTDDAAGYDLCCSTRCAVRSAGITKVPTGVHLAIPKGYVGIIKERSGKALLGYEVHGGVIDSDYRGEVCVLMTRNSLDGVGIFEEGERVAQIVFVRYETFEIERVDSVEEAFPTLRGGAGFGSTGN